MAFTVGGAHETLCQLYLEDGKDDGGDASTLMVGKSPPGTVIAWIATGDSCSASVTDDGTFRVWVLSDQRAKIPGIRT